MMRSTTYGLAFLLACARLVPGFSYAQETKIPAQDGTAYDAFGRSVAIDGDRAIAGAPGDNRYTGAAYLFAWDGAAWVQTTKLIPGQARADDLFGTSVAISGHRALVGAPGGKGAAYVFDYDGTAWVETARLTTIFASTTYDFGKVIALDGDRALVGASNGAYVFDYDGAAWREVTRLSSPSPGVALDGDRAVVGADVFDRHGTRWGQTVSLPVGVDGGVAIAGDRILLGNRLENHQSGEAYIFEWDGTAWIRTATLTAGDGSAGTWFGWSVALDGDRAVIGMFEYGAAYVFEYTGTAWIETAILVPADATGRQRYGEAVALDGDRVLVGASEDKQQGESAGAVYAFAHSDTGWNAGAKLVAGKPSGAGGIIRDDAFGSVVTLDGDRAAVFGSPSHLVHLLQRDEAGWRETAALPGRYGALDGDRALVDNTVFAWDGAAWNETAQIPHPDGPVALNGDRLLLSTEDPTLPTANTVQVYEYDGAAWSLAATLAPSDQTRFDQFGLTVALDGDRAVVGAKRFVESGSDGFNLGALYVFDFDGMAWTETAKLRGSAVEGDVGFGNTVSLSGDRIIAGSYGPAYIFAFDGAAWNEEAILMADDGKRFGSPLSFSGHIPFGSADIDGDYVIVGAPEDGSRGDHAGAAYLFAFDGSGWRRKARLTASDARANRRFGWSVALDGDRALVGAPAPFNMVGETGFGAVYVIDMLRSTASETAQEEVPHRPLLLQNYPNPFNPTTTIPFALGTTQPVLLEVLDLLGRRLAVLIDAPMPAGQHEVAFDGRRLPSGTYFYRLQAGTYTETRILILLK